MSQPNNVEQHLGAGFGLSMAGLAIEYGSYKLQGLKETIFPIAALGLINAGAGEILRKNYIPGALLMIAGIAWEVQQFQENGLMSALPIAGIMLIAKGREWLTGRSAGSVMQDPE